MAVGRALALSTLVLICSISTAGAHPHVFIEMTSAVAFNAEGKLIKERQFEAGTLTANAVGRLRGATSGESDFIEAVAGQKRCGGTRLRSCF